MVDVTRMVNYLDAVGNYLSAQSGFALREAATSQMSQMQTKLTRHLFTVESGEAIANAIMRLPLSTTDKSTLQSVLNSRVGLVDSGHVVQARTALQQFWHCHHYFPARLWSLVISAFDKSTAEREDRGSRQKMTYTQNSFGLHVEVVRRSTGLVSRIAIWRAQTREN